MTTEPSLAWQPEEGVEEYLAVVDELQIAGIENGNIDEDTILESAKWAGSLVASITEKWMVRKLFLHYYIAALIEQLHRVGHLYLMQKGLGECQRKFIGGVPLMKSEEQAHNEFEEVLGRLVEFARSLDSEGEVTDIDGPTRNFEPMPGMFVTEINPTQWPNLCDFNHENDGRMVGTRISHVEYTPRN